MDTKIRTRKMVGLSESVHKKVKIAAANKNVSIESYVEDALLQKLNTNINFNDQAAELRILMNEQRP